MGVRPAREHLSRVKESVLGYLAGHDRNVLAMQGFRAICEHLAIGRPMRRLRAILGVVKIQVGERDGEVVSVLEDRETTRTESS